MSLELCITKRFAGFKLDVSLACETGEILALLGASGSGKTLTLSCIAGVQKPDSGYITLDGETLYSRDKGVCLPPQRRGVGLMFQSYALFPNMTVEGNIMCGLNKVKGRALKRARLQELVGTLRLFGLEKRYPSELSGGQQQRVALARLLASEPKLLMLDEPFSAVDEALKWELEQELIDMLAGFNVPVLYVTHDMREVRRLCDRVCVLDNGSAQEPQTPAQLFERPLTIAAARLSGCENILNAKREDSYMLNVEELGISFKCACEVAADTRGAAIRAGSIHVVNTHACGLPTDGRLTSGMRAGGAYNQVSCTLIRVAEDEGRLVAVCRVNATGARLRAAVNRDELSGISTGDGITLSIPPQAICPLK